VTESEHSDASDEAQWLAIISATQRRGSAAPSVEHDAAVLEAARAAGNSIRSRGYTRSQLSAWVPASIAAALVLGIVIGRGSWLLGTSHLSHAQLTMPASPSARGASGSQAGVGSLIPVEQADPALWYRYIQELVFSGQTDLAEAHLRRFRELHPDFVYQP
jgi:hypothetical protein